MDDGLKNIAFGFLAFAVFHGCLEARAHQDIKHQVEDAFHHTGNVRVELQPRGMFGLYANDIRSIDIYGLRLQADNLPFGVHTKSGWQGSIQHIRLHYKDFRLRALHIDRLEADVPNVKYDVGAVIQHERLVLRGADIGPASVGLKTESLTLFIVQKFPDTFTDLNILLEPGHVILSGKTRIFGFSVPFRLTGHLKPRDSRFIDLIAEEIQINGIRVLPQTAQSLVDKLNPVLDINTDLGLAGIFTISDVAVDPEFVTIHGLITFPKID